VVFSVLNFGLQQSILNLQTDLHDLTISSTRADISIFIEPISVQNWTFVSNGVYLTVNGLLKNEGTRTTLIKKISLYATFPYSGGGEEVFTIPVNLTENFNIANLTIGENEERVFSINYFILHHLVLNDETGQIMQIGDSKAEKVGLLVWHYDGIDTILDSGETIF
jgi:hypothetical protein